MISARGSVDSGLSYKVFSWLILLTLGTVSMLLGGCQSTSHLRDNKTQISAYKTACESEMRKVPSNRIVQKMALPTVSSEIEPSKLDFEIQAKPENQDDAKALQDLAAARAACNLRRAELGVVADASDLILERRVDDLIAAVYFKEIDVGTFNLGVAEAAMERARFRTASAQAFAKGQEEGSKRAAALLQQMNTQMKLNAMQNQLNNINYQMNQYYSTYGKSTWYCNVTPGSVVTYVTCN